MKKIFLSMLFCVSSLYAIEKFGLPVPEKYRDRISCNQGLRPIISYDTWKGLASTNPFHNAIDYAVPEFTPVYATKDGVIQDCYPSFLNGEIWQGEPSLGGLIIIDHGDGFSTVYGHLSRTDYCEGDFVKKGQQIGLSGGNPKKRCSGISSGPHLHYAIIVNIADVTEIDNGTE